MPEGKKEIESLKQEFKKLKKQKDEYLAGWQRSQADFSNYKKEEAERIEEFLKYVNSEFILKILPVLDNFEKAEKEIPHDQKKDKFLTGFLQIKIQLQDFLKNQGVEEIKALGEKFDPNFQEAVKEMETKDKEPGIVVEEIQKGYKLNGKVIRPAKVKISK